MSISRQLSRIHIMILLKNRNENYFISSGNIITNNARCTREMKHGIAMAKAAISKKKKNLFSSKFDLNLRKKTLKCYIRSINFLWCCKLDTSKSRSEILGKIWNMFLEKDGEDQLDWSREKWRNITKGQGGVEYPTNKQTNKQKGRLTDLVTFCVGTALWNTLLKER